jgi:hypothetical protein
MPPIIDIDPVSGREILLMDAFAYNGQYEVKATGYRGTATAGATTNLDFAIGAEDRYINGLALILKNHAAEDLVGLQIVDVDNIFGAGAGYVLKTFGTNWNVDDSQQLQGKDSFNYAAKIPAGVYVRLIYESTGGTNVLVKLNLQLHKKVA